MVASKSQDALIILNPVSGQGDPNQRKKDIMQSAKAFGWKGELIETTRTRTATQIARVAIEKGVKHIIVGGGDGTIMEVLQAAVKKNVVIGVIPLGTGNLFAKNLTIPLDTKDAIPVAFQGKVQEIDIAKANDTYFSIIAGVGLDAEVMHHTDRNIKDKIGVWAYFLSGLQRFYRKSGKYRLVIDGKEKNEVRAKSIMIANMAKITGGINAVPAANPQSGSLRIGIVKAHRITAWLSILLHAFKDSVHKSPHYTLLKGNHIEITPRKGTMPYQCDGNAFPPTKKLTVTVYPAAVAVTVPHDTL